MASTHEEKYEDALSRLMVAHPALFAGRTFQIPSELPAGWYAIADRLCVELTGLLGNAAANWEPVQSKEKWGSWRLYWRLQLPGDDDSAPLLTADMQVPPGTPTAPVEGSEISPTPAGYRISVLPRGELRRSVHARVRAAEIATETTCLWCGEPGTYWTGGWVHVACLRHRRRDAITLEAWRKLQAIRREKYERDRDTKGETDEH